MAGSSLERSPHAMLVDEDDRALARLMAHARIFAAVPGLKKEIAGNVDAVAGIALTLQHYGFAVTLPGINNAFDWIEGRAEPSAQFYQALARRSGWDIRPLVRTRERAVARASHPGESPVDIEWTEQDAIDAHRLDEWVEDYVATGDKYQDSGRPVRRKVIVTVRVNGEPVEGDIPEWAAIKRDAGETKRFDAWWNYRVDMMWKSAAKRAAKHAIPDILLGGDSAHTFATPARGWHTDPTVIDVDAVDERIPDHVHDRAPESRGLDPDADDPARPF